MPFHKSLSGYSLMYRQVKVRNTSFRVGFLLYQLVITHIDSPLFGSRPQYSLIKKNHFRLCIRLLAIPNPLHITPECSLTWSSFLSVNPTTSITPATQFSQVSHYTVRNEVLDFHIPEHIITAWSLKYIPMLSPIFAYSFMIR